MTAQMIAGTIDRRRPERSDPHMANYTKRELRKLEIARAFAASQRPAQAPPICACGAPAVKEVNRPPRVAFYCGAHIDEAEAAFAAR